MRYAQIYKSCLQNTYDFPIQATLKAPVDALKLRAESIEPSNAKVCVACWFAQMKIYIQQKLLLGYSASNMLIFVYHIYG